MPDALLRTATLAALVFVAGAVGAVFLLHFRAWRRLPREAGLTPLHVMLVSMGVLVWGVALAWAQLDALSGVSSPLHVAIRTWMFLGGALIILAALAVVGGLQRKRLRFTRSERVIVAKEDAVTVAVTRKTDGG